MRLRGAAFPPLALLLAAPASAAITEQVMPAAGAYQLAVEVKTADPGEPAILHVASDWTKLHLRWRSADGRIRIDLIDDGAFLALDMNGYDCWSTARPLSYAQKRDWPLRRQLSWGLGNLLKTCPRVPGPARLAYAAEYARADRDFPAAIEAMKQKARSLFRGGLERCQPTVEEWGPHGPGCNRKG